MPKWQIEEKWKDEDVFVIGGGDSLRTFDWSLLKGRSTIGCNAAFLLGEEICKICVFGDSKWFEKFKPELQKFKNAVFTNHPSLLKSKIGWLWTMERKTRGLHTDALGWNGNTGAVAINLGLILGAKRIYLLGFDMKLSKDGKSNWHDRSMDKPNGQVYRRFIADFYYVAVDLLKKFPGREIINVTDDSGLDMFPKVGTKEFWEGYCDEAVCEMSVTDVAVAV